jgi:TP901-1 family phage major tail protein
MASTSAAQGGKDFLLKIGNGLSGAVTFTASSDLVGYTAHGLVAGDTVKFSGITGPTTPVNSTVYYVIASGLTADAFKIAATAGGSAINIDVDGTGTAVETFVTMGGLRSSSFSYEAEAIDITNQDSSQWKEILSAAGIRGVSLSGDGVFKDEATFKKARTIALAQTLRNFQLFVNTAGDYWSGSFKITSMEQSGEYNAESTYSMSLESSGAVSYTEV